MISEERKQEIYEQAKRVNDISEQYQLIHASFAIERLINENINEQFRLKNNQLRQELLSDTLDRDETEQLIKRIEETLCENRRSRISISIHYIDSLSGLNANTIRIGTNRNSISIALPSELKDIRRSDGTFDYDKMRKLRRLMAHELGHVILHLDSITEEGIIDEDGSKEEESNHFADAVIELRRNRNTQFYNDDNYKNM